MNKNKMRDYLETDRLVLFPYTKENLALFNSDLPRFEAEFGVVYRGEELDHLLQGFLKKLETEIAADPEHYLFFTEFLIVLKENDHVIGSIDFKYVPKDGVTEVGYGMNPAYTGHGYMTEALSAFLRFGKSLGIKTVRADTKPDNVKSQNVLKRCGFSFLREDGNLWWEKDLTSEEKMYIREVALDESVLAKLIAFSEDWAAENSCYGYRPNGRPDIEGNRIFLAEENGETVGYLFGKVSQSKQMKSIMPEGTPYFEVEELYVVPGKRSQGIGRELFLQAEKAVAAEADYMVLSTATKNWKAIFHFYLDELNMEFWSARLFKRIEKIVLSTKTES